MTNETGNGEGPPSPFCGVILDWGGVMTNPIRDMVAVWLDDEDVDHAHYAAVMRPWVTGAYDQNGDTNPIHALERGECTVEEFELLLAGALPAVTACQVVGRGPADPDVRRFEHGRPMQTAVQAMPREAGLRTGLLSNSWGRRLPAAPVSRHVRRRGDLRRGRHAQAGGADLPARRPDCSACDPAECVFVDDIEANTQAAEAIGMTAILHHDPVTTLAQLGELLGLALTG